MSFDANRVVTTRFFYNDPMHLRPATPDDAEPIAEIYNDAIENTTAIMWHEPKPASLWQGRLTDRPERYPALVATDPAGGVVAFTMLAAYDDKCGYRDVAEWSLYVAPAWRGRGVGRALGQAVLAAARDQRLLHSILSRVTQGNAASERLHQRLGFREVGSLKRLGSKFGQRYDVILYQLIL